MTESKFLSHSLKAFALVFTITIADLLWQHFNGGVASHYLLHNPDLPSISNWWSLLVIPMLTWVTSVLLRKRLAFDEQDEARTAQVLKHAKLSFIAMLVFNLIQSALFVLGYHQIVMFLALGLLISGLFLPLYRAEYILGHVLGGFLVFGAVIPLIGMSVMGLVSALAHFAIKPLVMGLFKPKATA